MVTRIIYSCVFFEGAKISKKINVFSGTVIMKLSFFDSYNSTLTSLEPYNEPTNNMVFEKILKMFSGESADSFFCSK